MSGGLRSLIAEPLMRWGVCAAVGISIVIIYWLQSLRAQALDMSFEGIFNGLFLFQDYPLALCGSLILFLALLAPVQKWAFACTGYVAKHVYAVAALYFMLLAASAVLVYHAYPLSMDEYSPYFQSKVFAAGEMTARWSPRMLDWMIPESFQNLFLNVSHADGRVVSAYWPGFALLLTPFTLLGVSWLCNPTLGAIGLLLVYRLAMRVFEDQSSAGLAVMATLAAPAFAINSISFYSMTAHLVFNAGFALCLMNPTVQRAALAGLLGSVALCLHNPVPHFLFAAPWIVWLALRPASLRPLLALVAGYLPLVLILGFGWAWFAQSVADSATTILYEQSATWTARIQKVFSLPSPSLLYARTVALMKMWIWAVPATLVLAAVGAWRLWGNHWIRLFSCSAIFTFCAYLFVPFSQGHGWGYRYFQSAWFALPLLAVGALRETPGAKESASVVARSLPRYFAACCALSALFLIPLSAYLVEGHISRHLAQIPVAAHGDPKVVLISAAGYYSEDLVQNDPFLREPVVKLISHGRKRDREQMAKEFPQLELLQISAAGSVWGVNGN